MAEKHSPDLVRDQELTDEALQESLRMDGQMDGRQTRGRMDEWTDDGGRNMSSRLILGSHSLSASSSPLFFS